MTTAVSESISSVEKPKVIGEKDSTIPPIHPKSDLPARGNGASNGKLKRGQALLAAAQKSKGRRSGKSSANVSDSGDVDSTDEREKETEEEKPVKCWYMVRLPRPEGKLQETETSNLEALVQLKQERVDYLNAAFRVKQVNKSTAHGHTEAALDDLKAAGAEIREKIDVLKPLQERLNAHQKEESNVKNLLRELKISSEEELDQTIASLEHRIAHESLTLNVEKQLVRQIKQLQASREAVRECSARKASVSSARAERDELRTVVKVLKEEVDLLRLQENMQREVYRKRHDEEKAFETSIKEIIAERQTVIGEREQIRDEIRALRNSIRKEEGDFHKNRRLIRKLREMVEKKDYEAADTFSQEQMDRILGRLSTDAEYREEYMRLMRKQNPRRYLESDDDDFGGPLDTSAGNAPATERLTQEQVKAKAKAIISDLIKTAAPAPAVVEVAAPETFEEQTETKEEPAGPSTPPPKEASKPLPSKKEAPAKRTVAPPARKAPEVPEVVMPVIQAESVSSREEDESNVPTFQADPAAMARAKQEEAEERKRRLAAKAAKAKVVAETRALEEAQRKAEKKARKRVGKTAEEETKTESVPVEVEAEDEAPAAAAAACSTAAGTQSAERLQPTTALRRYVKNGKVVVETPAAARWRQLQRYIIMGVSAFLFMMLVAYVFRHSLGLA